MDDTTTATAMLAADSGRGTYGDPVVLVIRCKSNHTDLFIDWSSYLADEPPRSNVVPVTFRVAAAPARTEYWHISADNEATFYPAYAIAFIKGLRGADRFVAEVTPYAENPITAVFDLTGVERAIAEVGSTCGWAPAVEPTPTDGPPPSVGPTPTPAPAPAPSPTDRLLWVGPSGVEVATINNGTRLTLHAEVNAVDGQIANTDIYRVGASGAGQLVDTVEMRFQNGVGEATWEPPATGVFRTEYKFVVFGRASSHVTVLG